MYFVCMKYLDCACAHAHTDRASMFYSKEEENKHNEWEIEKLRVAKDFTFDKIN